MKNLNDSGTRTKKINALYRLLSYYFAVFLLTFGTQAQLVINPPTFPSANTVQLTLSGTDTNLLYNIQYTPDLSSIPFSTIATGTVAQTSFTFTMATNSANFFRAFGTNGSLGPLTVDTPTFTPGGGTYSTAQNVTISCSTPLAAIYYTTNGATPTTSDIFIPSGGTVFLSSIVTLKAKAFRSGYVDSGVASATYNINSGPSVSAGQQQIITTSSTTLEGLVTDDGLTGGGIKFTNWTTISGPGTVSFGNAGLTNSTVTFGSDGIYVLQLSACDGQYTNSAQVTIAVNPTLSVSLDSPAGGSTYTVPTNFTLSATATCGSGSVTQVAFYANSALIGVATNAPYIFDWRSVSAGTLVLTAVASTTDPANTGLASSPVNVTVNWPTNVGQVTFSATDLQIPAAGLPITVNRLYDTRFATAGSFGYNGKLDYEQINIQKSGPLATGWFGVLSGGINYSVADTAQHVVTVSLSPTEQYHFIPQVIFNLSGTNTISSGTEPTCYNFFDVHLIFTPVGQGQLSVATPSPTTVGMDDGLSGWTVPLTITFYDDADGFPTFNYEPSFSAFTFTAPDGTKYNFDDNGNVSQHTDRNGNYVQYSSSGIFHSSGKEVLFDRDPTTGNITAVYDPNSQDGFGSITGPPAVTYAYDTLGNLTNVSRLVDRIATNYVTTSYAYTNTAFPNNITAITDGRGIVSSRYEYDSIGQLNKQYDGFNHFSIFSYDTVNHRQVFIDRLGHPTVQNFSPAGLLASIQDANGAMTSYAYDSQGRQIAETNALNKVTIYGYDGEDNVTEVENPTGSASSATYNSFGEPLVEIDDLGNGTTNAYDGNGNLLFVTNALNIVTAYGYDSQGNILAETNALGLPEQVIVNNLYDQFGDLTNATTLDASLNPLRTIGYTYDANGNKMTEITTRTTPGGVRTMTTQWIYDGANRITANIDAMNNTNFTFYNGIGKQSQTVDALNRTNSFFYDANGALTNTTYADGLFESIAYDDEGRQLTTTDRAMHTTSYLNDPTGRLLRTTYPDNSYVSSTYDAAGQFISSTINTPASGMIPTSISITTAQYGYDSLGRQIALTNALNQVTQFAYDANGNQTNVVDALNRTNSYVYDALNQRVAVIYPDTTSEGYGYDGLGRRIAITNQANVITLLGFDALGRMTAVTNDFGGPHQSVTRYVYDEVGNLTEQVDALNRTNFFEYDDLGRRVKQTTPGSRTSLLGYDAVGNVIRETNFNNVVITNQYDALNRLTNKASAGGYRVALAYSPTSQRTNMVDASGTNSYTYDNRDRLMTKITPEGTLNYTYDGFGNVQTVQSSTSGGTSLTYNYDVLNRLTNVVDRFTNSTTYDFDAVGNLRTVALPNKITNVYSFDALNRLTNLTATSAGVTVASFAYKLAPVGNRTNLTETYNGVNRTNAWNYDTLYRLLGETITASSGPTGQITNNYDNVGNRLTRTSTVSGITNQSFTFNTNDQLTVDIYDNNGNTRTNGANVFLYDAENQLTNATVNGTNIVIVYDGDGNRVRTVVGTTTNFYLIDDLNLTGYAQVVEEKTGTALVRAYTYGLTRVSQRDALTSFYGYDGNGNVRYLTATNGAISDTYTYDAFGNVITSTGTATNFYRYAGEQFDPTLGLYYLRARYMNPGSGRFLTRDSFEGNQEDPKSLHRYTYAEGDPVDNLDPSGHFIGAIDILSILASIRSPVISKTQSATVKKPLRDRPKGQAQRLFTAVIFSESSAGTGEDAVEKLAIGATIYNIAFYAKLPPGSKQKKNYNAPSFGDGSVLGAIKTAFPKSYKRGRWNLIANATDLKQQADLDQALIGPDRDHYNLCVDAANAVKNPPMAIPQFNNGVPIGFNKADNQPPNPARQHKIGHAGATTFYGFDSGREYE